MKKIIFLIPLIVFAHKIEVTAKKCQKNLICITLKAEGKNIYFPYVKKIGKYKVISTYFNTDIMIINEQIREKATETIIVKANKDNNITIPSLSIIINGKTYKTKPFKIK